jgi:DNA-binding NtrC family response regulator
MSNSTLPVLLVDDEEQILYGYSLMLQKAGTGPVLTIDDSRKVLPLLAGQQVSVIVLDLIMPYIPGTELLAAIRREFPHIPVIVMTALNELNKAVECMKEGASDYLVKPVEKNRFISSIQRVIEMNALRSELTTLTKHFLKSELEHQEAFRSIITRSEKMKSLFHYIEAIAKYHKPVFITGETGTGKELFARSIHDVSGVEGSFTGVNVAGLDDTMFSDTLFGHKKGAYTGADKEREGMIVRASEGTLLLDEIGDLNESSQVKLLRLLEEQSYYPLGSDIPEKSSARIIANSNQDIQKQIMEGTFRKDLYYRLCTHHIHIPPLRDRSEDIPLLLDHFLAEAAALQKKKPPTPPSELVTLLSTYTFPGNARELKAMVFDAVAQHKTGMLSMDSFKEFIKQKGAFSLTGSSLPLRDTASMIDVFGHFPTLKETGEYLVSEALKRSNGNQGIAASLLGIKRQALNRRLKRST